MATGFKIWQPNGKILTAKAGTEEEQLKNAAGMLDGWHDYLERNWLNDDVEDMFSPELRVKRFLDSIGYYLLYGKMDGIVTTYKDTVNQAREIPASSCPSYVENIIYASGGASGTQDAEERQSFKTITEILDEKVPKRKVQPKQKAESRRRRIEKVRQEHGGAPAEVYTVDRDGFFLCDGMQMMIHGYEKYNAKVVHKRNGETDILFDMDKIIRCGDGWYDQNWNLIPDECISLI